MSNGKFMEVHLIVALTKKDLIKSMQFRLMKFLSYKYDSIFS